MKSNIKNAAEAAKNREIYNKLADIAREVFNHVICAPGSYSVADIAKNINSVETSERVRKADFDGVVRDVYVPRITRSWKGGFSWADGYDPMKDIHTAEVGSFKCSVNGWGVFLALQKAATAWTIPTAARPVFARKAETVDTANAAEVVAFAVNKELRALAAIVDPREKLRPVYTFIHIDTRRRAAVACNGQLLRVVALPDIETAATAADSYLIAPALLKSGKGRVVITADGYASNGETVAPLGEGRFPNWAGLIASSLAAYKYSEAARVELSRTTFNELKKAVKAAAKLSDRVTIAAKSYDTAATVYAYDIDSARDITTAAKLAAPVRSSFNVVLKAAQFAKLSDVTAFYFVGNSAPVLAAASLGFYYFNPLLAEDGDKYYTPFNIAPAGENYDPLAEFAEVIAPAAVPAAVPADDSQDTTTTHDSESEPTTVAADDSQNTPAEVIAAPAEDNIETPAADDSQAEAAAPAAVPAAVIAAADLLAAAEVRAAAKAIAKAKTADDHESQKAARDARRLLTTAHGLTLTEFKIKTADGLTLARFIYTYGRKSRRTLSAPLLKVAVEFATLESLADEWAELTPVAPADDLTASAPAEDLTVNTNEPTPAEAVEGETVAAPDSIESEAEAVTDTPATLLTVEDEEEESERERPARALLLTIARHVLRLTAAAALLLLMMTIAPDRAAGTLAAPADLLTITPDTLAADSLTADSEAESREELAAPADSPRPAAERRHARENKRESRALLTVVTADSIAAPAAEDSEADTLTAQAATLEAPQAIATPADTLAAGSLLGPAQEVTNTTPADIDSEADTITPDETTDEDDSVTADSESGTTNTNTAANGHAHAHGSTPATIATPCSPSTPVAPVAPIIL